MDSMDDNNTKKDIHSYLFTTDWWCSAKVLYLFMPYL